MVRVNGDGTAEARVRAILAADPDAWINYSLADLAREVGVSRERVRQLLPDYARDRRVRVAQVKIQRYFAEHPELMADGTPLISASRLARTIQIPWPTASRAWESLGFPLKRRPRHEGAADRRRARRDRRTPS